jgi:hypothetical protein
MINQGIYAGMRPRVGELEPSYSDMTPLNQTTSSDPMLFQNIQGAPRSYEQVPKPVSEFTHVIFRPVSFQQKPLVAEPDGIVIGKPDLPMKAGIQAPMGFAPKQEKGLAFSPQFPIAGQKVMPIAGFYDVNRSNVLGGAP